jgi:uncharacterized protein YbjT (DUF2867 family)
MGIKVILTGATGMVGEGVLLVCLEHQAVDKVLVVGRRSCGITHEKLEELIVPDLGNLNDPGKLAGYDACFFCAGVSSIGKNEEDYTKLTYNLTVDFAEAFKKQNKNNVLTFTYVSGYGTDSTEQGKSMWARVKGRTENRLIEMFGRRVYLFRPGYMKPVKGQKNILKMYIGWQLLYPVLRAALMKFVCSLEEVGLAMINATDKGHEKNVLEVRDIVKLAKD